MLGWAIGFFFAALVAAGQPIPWIASPAAPAQGESQRLIAVHL